MKHTALLLTLMLLAACSQAAVSPESQTPRAVTTIYVVQHEWHTGIVIPADSLKQLGFLEDHFTTASWYEIGWGDNRFYQTGDNTASLAIQALFWPTTAVIHVAALPTTPDSHFKHSEAIALPVSDSGYRAMVSAIATDFAREGDDRIQALGRGRYGDSLFFNARGSFHLFNTCNTWTAKRLQQAGVPVRSFMTLTPGGVMRQLENITAGRDSQ